MNKLEFLKSVRFWKVVVAFVVYALGAEGVIPAPIADTVAGILGVSVAIRTIDREAELFSGK